jgi:hypothetical protein
LHNLFLTPVFDYLTDEVPPPPGLCGPLEVI